MFEALWHLVKMITKLPDDKVLEIMCLRLTKLEQNLLWADQVQDLDEATDVLDEPDRRVLKEEQDRNKKGAVTSSDYKKSYSKEAKRQRKNKDKAHKGPVEAPKKKENLCTTFAADFDVPQKQASKWLPPGAHVWRGISGRCAWHAHLKPNKRVSCPFKESGVSCREALRRVLVMVWDQHLLKAGEEWSKCPFDLAPPKP